jgi:predicted mannosyl-3-phosphoglycerate phosphatase (HAD superfamily)
MLTGQKETEYETRLKELGLKILEGGRHHAKAHDAQDTACK